MKEKPKKLHFGTAGIPLSTKHPSTLEGIKKVNELGLSAMELEFVRGVNLDKEKAKIVGKVAKEYNVILTAHAPYFINLNTPDKSKWYASIQRIVDSLDRLSLAEGYSVVFHAAYYMKSTKDETYKKVKEGLERIIETMKENKYDVWIRPETMGKKTQFGDLDELISLSKEFDRYVLPAIDFAHLHARYNGWYKDNKALEGIFIKIENELGKYALENMHIHFSGIEYSEKGEKRHLNLKESDFPYKKLAELLVRYDVKGVIISESPNIEGDALLLKKTYEEMGGRT